MTGSAASSPKRVVLIALASLAVFVSVYGELLLGKKTFIHDSIVWYGIFHYFVVTLAGGQLPLWDPYAAMGTYFYPNIPIVGLLDPSVLVPVLLVKAGVHPLMAYLAMMLIRFGITILGAYLLFRHVTGSRTVSAFAAAVLLLALPHAFFPQFGVVVHLYLTPLATYAMLRFLEAPRDRGHHIFLPLCALIVGVAVNIYIPAHFSFNLLVVLVGAVLFGAGPRRDLLLVLKDRRFMLLSAGVLLFAGMMLAPPLSVYWKDASGDGELFPMQRIVQKNNRIFKQIMATEVTTSNLSEKFTDVKAVFNSWGNLVGLLYPDNVRTSPYWLEKDLISEIHLYIGAIPFVIGLVGMFVARSRFRAVLGLAMVLTFLSGFSPLGTHDKPFSAFHHLLNTVFPPLKMLQGRQNFGYFTLLYLGAFVAIGAQFLHDPDNLRAHLKKVLFICAGVVLTKLVIGISYGSGPVVSLFDAAVFAEIGLFSLVLVAVSKNRIGTASSSLIVLALVLADLWAYNGVYRNEILQDGATFFREFGAESQPAAQKFEFYREPLALLPISHPVAFEESISRRKGALSYGYNHLFFTTKRYYDMVTHLPLESQFTLNGIVYPIIRFYPERYAVSAGGRRDLLARLGEEVDTSGWLFIEEGRSQTPAADVVKDFGQYRDVPSLTLVSILTAYDRFLRDKGQYISFVRTATDRYMNAPSHRITVESFGVNEVTCFVSLKESGYLYFNDGWSRYWKAFDGAKQLTVLKANYNSKAVYLTPGDHTVRFVFDPAHYKLALLLYCAGLVGLSCLTAFLAVRFRR